MRFLATCWGVGALALSTAAFATPTAVPYTEDFTSSTTTCDAAFSTSSCPTGWQGLGDDDSLEYVDAGGDAGITITPGTSTPNGFSKTFAVTPSNGYFYQKTTAWATGGTATLLVRHKFMNSSGVTVGTSTYSHALTSDPTTIQPFDDTSAIPAGTTKVQVLVGAVNPSNSSVEVEVPGTMAEFAAMSCLICWFADTAGDECDQQIDCDPNISCEDEAEPICVCDPGVWPTCDAVVICSCPAVTLGP